MVYSEPLLPYNIALQYSLAHANLLFRVCMLSAQATITKCHRLGGLNNIILFLIALEAGKFKIKYGSMGFWWELSFPSLQMVAFVQYSHMMGRRGSQASSLESLLIGALFLS